MRILFTLIKQIHLVGTDVYNILTRGDKIGDKMKDDAWDIRKEGKLNKGNIVFTEEIKEMVDSIKDCGPQEIEEDPGLLICIVCNTGSSPMGEAFECGDIFVGYCQGCGDHGEFVYERDLA